QAEQGRQAARRDWHVPRRRGENRAPEREPAEEPGEKGRAVARLRAPAVAGQLRQAARPQGDQSGVKEFRPRESENEISAPCPPRRQPSAPVTAGTRAR